MIGEEPIHIVESINSDPIFKESELGVTILDEEYDEIQDEEEEKQESSIMEEMVSKTFSIHLILRKYIILSSYIKHL